ncbi:MAG: riboflavin transport system ATP-binding protein [Pseudothermotoga sp.]|nr:riboflavin transport system ATP-binding protein [Pseudothermotoga sp.]
MRGKTIVQLLNVQKTFYPSGVKALKGVNLFLEAGSVHALLGANGAGKTTLVRILAGEIQPDAGEIFVDGRAVNFRTPKDAMRHGIVLVHQNLSLVEELTVFENLFLGREPRRLFFLDRKKAEQRVKDLSERLFLVALDRRVVDLSMAEKQKIEIVRALLFGARVLLLDEPTAYLSESEEERLFELLASLKRNGCAILFITHDLNQALKIADRVTVLREGETVLSEETSHLNVRQVIEAMGFRSSESPRVDVEIGEELLKVSDITLRSGKRLVLDRVSLSVRQGENVGLFGLGNDGQFDLLEVLIGLKKPVSGRIFFQARDITRLSIRERRRLGIAYVPKDRLREALNLEGSILENAMVNVYREIPFAKFGLLNWALLQDYIHGMLKEFQVETNSIMQPVITLSGWNLQRLILARELFRGPKLFLACRPTSGLDAQVQHYIAERLQQLKSWGCALIATNDAEEAFGLCDKVLIFSKGRLKRTLYKEQLTEPSVLVSLVGEQT